MESAFAGLSAALSAMYSQKRGLEVAGQNVANVNTEGYSRQRVDMASIGGSAVPAMYSITNGIGAGVQVSDVTRAQDALLELRGHAEHANNSYLTAQKQTYTAIEQVFTEPSDTGLA